MAKSIPITEEQAAEWEALDEQRRELNRQSAALGKRQSALADHFLIALSKAGKKSIKRGNFTIGIELVKRAIGWKAEFVKRHGPLEAEEIAAAAPDREKAFVERT